MVHGFGVNSSRAICEGGILLCKFGERFQTANINSEEGLTCYMSAKVMTYYFLVERAVCYDRV
jgi:hypothetical protein